MKNAIVIILHFHVRLLMLLLITCSANECLYVFIFVIVVVELNCPEFTHAHTITDTPIRGLGPSQYHWHTGVTSKLRIHQQERSCNSNLSYVWNVHQTWLSTDCTCNHPHTHTYSTTHTHHLYVHIRIHT